MEGLLFLFACIGITLVAFWVMQNDAAGPTEPTKGLFMMKSVVPNRKSGAGQQASPNRPHRHRAKHD